MHRIAITLALALGLAGCGGQVPLVTRGDDGPGCLGDLWFIADVIADPISGTPTDAATGEPFTFPNSFTARRGLFEVEVLDAQARVVLTTGGRYSMCPGVGLLDGKGWVIGAAQPCPGGELGSFQSLRGKDGPHPKCPQVE